jgi:prophage tail gpP-like protein
MSSIIVRNVTRNCDLVWRYIKINKSLDEICHTLELELASTELTRIRRHDKIEVRYKNSFVNDSGGERRITTIRVDAVTATVDSEKHSIKVIGRSPARDIIDSTWSGAWHDMTLRAIVKEICGEFNIECDSFPLDPDPTGEIKDFTWCDESPWTNLITEADTQHFILTSNEAGNLYLWKVRANVQSEPFRITEGVNIINAEWKENGAEQFREYTVTGGFELSEPVIDETCPTNRRLLVNVPNSLITREALEARAKTEMLRRREIETLVTVPGWGLTDMQIKSLGNTFEREIFWGLNMFIPVDIPSLGLKKNLLVSAVTHEASNDELITTVTLVNREKYL